MILEEKNKKILFDLQIIQKINSRTNTTMASRVQSADPVWVCPSSRDLLRVSAESAPVFGSFVSNYMQNRLDFLPSWSLNPRRRWSRHFLTHKHFPKATQSISLSPQQEILVAFWDDGTLKSLFWTICVQKTKKKTHNKDRKKTKN